MGPAGGAGGAAANRLARLAPTARLAKAVAGVDQRRDCRAFARTTLRRGARDRRRRPSTPDVWLWADTFTDHLPPGAGHAAIRLLEAAGLTGAGDRRARLLRADLGHHRPARPGPARSWRAPSATLHPYVARGVPVVGLEPSCLATLRSDAVELVDDPRAAEVAAGMRTLAELLTGPTGRRPT